MYDCALSQNIERAVLEGVSGLKKSSQTPPKLPQPKKNIKMVYYYEQDACNISDNIYNGNSVFYVYYKETQFTCWERDFLWAHFRDMSGLSLLEYFRHIGREATRKILEDQRLPDSLQIQEGLARRALKELWERERKSSPNLPFPEFLKAHLQEMNQKFVTFGLSNLSALKNDRRQLSYQKKAAHYSLKM